MLKIAPLFLVAVLFLAGCNAGMAPAGMSHDDAVAALNALSPQDQIKYYQSSPMPQAQKQAKIAEIEAKFGIKADATGAPKTGQ